MGILAKDFWTFKQYLEDKRTGKLGGEKGGLAGTPKKEIVSDYHGPSPSKPAKNAERGKGWEIGVKMKGEPARYKGVGTDPGLQVADGKGGKPKKGEKGGFAHEGDDDLIYEPKAGIVDKAGEGGNKKKTWPKSKDVPKPAMVKTKAESFLDRTKEMSLSEFARHIRKGIFENKKDVPQVIAYGEGPFSPDPIQAIKYITFLAAESSSVMRALLVEAKRAGCLENMVAGLLGMPETYTEIVNQMSADPAVSRQIVRAMNDQYLEQVGPPAHKDEVDDEEPGDVSAGDSPPDNIEGEDSPPGDDPEPDGEEDDESEDEPNFDTDTGSGGITGGEGGDVTPAHQQLADAIGKHKMMAKRMQAYMGSY